MALHQDFKINHASEFKTLARIREVIEFLVGQGGWYFKGSDYEVRKMLMAQDSEDMALIINQIRVLGDDIYLFERLLFRYPKQAKKILFDLYDCPDFILDKAIDHPHEVELVMAFNLLNRRGLLGDYEQLVRQYPQDAVALSHGLITLHREGLLRKKNIAFLTQYPIDASKLASGLISFLDAGIFSDKNRNFLIKHKDIAHDIGTAISELHKFGLLCIENQELLFKYPDFSCELADGFINLQKSDLFTHKNKKLLAKHAKDAALVGSILSKLNCMKITVTSEDFQILLRQNIKHVNDFLWGVIELHDSGILSETNFNLLMQQDHRRLMSINSGVRYLREHGDPVTNQKNFDLLIQYMKGHQPAGNLMRLADAFRWMKRVGILTDENKIFILKAGEFADYELIVNLLILVISNNNVKKNMALLNEHLPYINGIALACKKNFCYKINQHIFEIIIQHAHVAEGVGYGVYQVRRYIHDDRFLSDNSKIKSILLENGRYAETIGLGVSLLASRLLDTATNFRKLVRYREFGETILDELLHAPVINQATFDAILLKCDNSRALTTSSLFKRPLYDKQLLPEMLDFLPKQDCKIR